MIQVIAHLLTRLSAGQRCEEEPRRLLGQREVRVHGALESKTLRGTRGHEALKPHSEIRREFITAQ